jgi:hypothetical protein
VVANRPTSMKFPAVSKLASNLKEIQPLGTRGALGKQFNTPYVSVVNLIARCASPCQKTSCTERGREPIFTPPRLCASASSAFHIHRKMTSAYLTQYRITA